MSDTPEPDRQIILAAGMSRSGSTWQFNATRLLLEEAQVPHWAGWIDDLAQAQSPLCLVKVHSPAHFQGRARVVLTTWRPFEDCLRSLIRMGWLAPEKAPVQRSYHQQRACYHHWAARSHLQTCYAQLRDDPQAAVGRIQKVLSGRLGIAADPGAPARVVAALEALRPPPEPQLADDGTTATRAKRHDPRTLLHPGHIAALQGGYGDRVPDIAQWLAELP